LEIYVCPGCRGRGFVRGRWGVYRDCLLCDYKSQVQSSDGAAGFAELVEAGVTCSRCGRRDERDAQRIHLFSEHGETTIRLCGTCFNSLPGGRRAEHSWTC
jgi:hypothetical protein